MLGASILVAGSAFWCFWDWREDVRNIFLVLGGLVGFCFAWVRIRIADKQAALAERGHVTDRLTKAVAQISSDKLYERLGGIHALSQIAQSAKKNIDVAKSAGDAELEALHREDLNAVRNTLCEFIRTPPYAEEQAKRESARKAPDVAEGNGYPDHVSCPDVIAAINVMPKIGRQERKNSEQYSSQEGFYLDRYDISNANLSHLNLDHVDFSYFRLHEGNLRHSSLNGVNFTNASLEFACMKGAFLVGANLQESYLVGAKFNHANIGCANFTEAHDLSDPSGFTDSWYWTGYLPEGLPRECLAVVEEREA